MARRRHSSGGSADSGTWMNTYADMVTLLLTFFAVLLSMSSVNEEKFIAFIRSFAKNDTVASSIVAYLGDDELGDTYDGASMTEENAMSYLYEKLSAYVEETAQGDAIEVYGGDDVVYIRFNSAAFFEPDRYVLRPGGEEILSYVGDALKANEGSISHINICGHTANPPGASAIGVWMLSGERAAVVAAYFEDEKKIESDKMIVMGYGKNFPIGDNSTDAGMEKNRRVELVVIGNNSTLDQDIYNQFDPLYDSSAYPANGSSEDILKTPTDDTAISNSAEDPTNLIAESAAAGSVPAANTGGAAGAAASSTEQAASP